MDKNMHGAKGWMRAATYASTATALLLISLKAWAWAATDSIAILSSLIDSLLDGFASLVTLVAVHHALVPADREHRFGHGKAEPLAALTQATFVTGSAIILVIQAMRRLFNPPALGDSQQGIALMAASILITLALVLFQSFVVKRTGSVAIRADRLHYLGDLLPNMAVIAALVLVGITGLHWLDPLFGMAAALYLLRGAWMTGREALDMLMDRELPDDIRNQVRDIALAQEGVLGLHDLRSRQAGSTYFFQMHLELPGHMPLTDAHEIADQVEIKIRDRFPGAQVIVHQDPHDISPA
ncbi:cation diffusion facilitator family transporter [Aestuariispira insulae]|nr:cation diffusion facilitator family transporter [Aestuariispira insulae]